MLNYQRGNEAFELGIRCLIFSVQPLRKPTLNPAWRDFLGGSRKEVIHAQNPFIENCT